VEEINIIRAKRMKKRWTQLELAKVSGVPQCTISQLERGNRKYPTYETIRKIAKALDLTLEEIYLLQDHKEKGAVKEEEGKAPAFL
jgi:transcriptional regulator with XRE-family HTH domain